MLSWVSTWSFPHGSDTQKDNEGEETDRNEQACVDTLEESQFLEHNKN